MVKIRLRRVGAKKQPFYRVVVADSSAPREGRFIEIIGTYNPRTDPPSMEIDAERAVHWLGVGAQPTEAVGRMLDKLGIMARAQAIKRGEVQPEVRTSKPEPIEGEEEVLPEETTDEFADLDLEDEDLDMDDFEDVDEDLDNDD